MKSKDIFGLAVRIAGLIFLYQGLASVPNAIASLCPSVAVPRFYFRNLFPSLLIVGWPLLIGYWLVRGAPWLMRLAYRDSPEEKSSTACDPLTPSHFSPRSH